MDVVYFVKPGDDNEELRYSLRSLRNVQHANVWIVGYKPRWVQNVLHLPYEHDAAPDVRHPKWHHTWNMLRAACEHPDISEDFILFNDDFFVMQPVDEMPVLHRGPILGVVEHLLTKPNIYVETMLHTKEALHTLGKGSLCYEVHIPFAVNKQRMLFVQKLADTMRGSQCVNKRSLYGNYWKIGGQVAGDVKVDNAHPHFDEGGIFLSTTEQSFAQQPVGAFIRSRFPDACYYESI